MKSMKQLEQAALDAHRHGMTWREFWPTVEREVTKAEPYDRQRYHRLVRRLSHLVTCGDLDGHAAIRQMAGQTLPSYGPSNTPPEAAGKMRSERR